MLGKGSFARVYLAQNKATGERYAVKAFSKEFIEAQEKGKDSLVIEVDILKQLDHPNIIKFYEIHETQNSLYLVMEVLSGGEIFSLSNGKLSPEDAYEIIRSLLHGIEYLDSKGIIHRDLKPENIILKFENTPLKKNMVKIVDFGLSTMINVDEYLFKRCGTPGFVAPEVINADKNDPNLRFSSKCDIFSLGIIFYFMLTGKIPYDGDSFSDVLQNNKKAEIDFSLPYLNKIDKTALDLLKHMLEIDVNKRYSAEECLEHPYFDKETVHSQTRRDSINLTDNVNLFKEKYKKPRESKFTDSIRFNVNPDVNGRTDTFNMVDDSPKTQNRMRIDSFHSKNILNSPKNSPKALPGMNSPKMSHNPIYRRALMGPAGKYVGENRSRDTSIDTSPKTNSGDDGSPVGGFSSRVSKFGQKN